MSGYLDDYGVKEERREEIIKKILVAALLVVVAGGILYFIFRDYREKQQLQTFLNLLESKEYQSAYRLWGCTDDHPCPQYKFEKFMEDWGPESRYADIRSGKITKTRSCTDGIIQTLTFGEDDEIWLWVSRGDQIIGFAPWPICNPRIPKSEIAGP